MSKLLLICWLSVGFLQAQNGTLRPEDFLPHQVGEQFTEHHQLVSYFQHVAERNPNTMRLERYGVTNQNRPLVAAIFSSPENLARLEEIRTQHLGQIGLFTENNTTKLAKRQDIAIVWLSMSVHGNEPSGSECSLELAWRLALQNDPAVASWLKNTVVILDPSLNPDGYNRYTQWYKNASSSHVMTQPEAREHNEPWPSGRLNHYHFDLNRDWAWGTQVESRQRLAVYQLWMPHVHADLHEQYVNSPYYFAPAAEPLHPFISKHQREFQSVIGRNHAAYFDENGWLYFTQQVFDLFYPSYGDTYPMFSGAIGMTYEQAGHSTAGRAIITGNGDTLKLDDRVQHHLTTSLSTIETASKHAQTLSEAFVTYFETAQHRPQGPHKTYLIKKENDPFALKNLCSLLESHGIKYQAAEKMSSGKGFGYLEGKETAFEVEKGDLLISALQPRSVLLQVLFEPESELRDTLTYDITAWNLPMAFGLKAYATTQNIASETPFVFSAIPKQQKPASMAHTAWCLPRTGLGQSRFLVQCQKKGLNVRYALTAFSIDELDFAPGTLVITRADNRAFGADMERTLRQIAEETNENLHSVRSSWTSAGPNFGSDDFRLFSSGTVAVVYSDDVDPSSYGFLWHFFEQDLDMPFVALPAQRIASVNALNYQTLILPNGKYRFGPEENQALEQFVKKGGKLIVLENAFQNLDEEIFEAKAKAEAGSEKPMRSFHSFMNKERSQISESLPGAIIKVDLDETHPIAHGLGKTYNCLKTSPLVFENPEKGDKVASIPENIQQWGFIGYKAKENLKQGTVLMVQNLGDGQVIYFSDDPLFRGFWHTGKVLFSNALFF